VKGKLNELETRGKDKTTGDLYRGTDEFTNRYQPRTNLAKDAMDETLRFPQSAEQVEGSLP
jgi:hypothetical protein